jgi:lysozyme family protein
MNHPFDLLKNEYSELLLGMKPRSECVHEIDQVANKLLGFKAHYQPVSEQDGVPIIFIATSFEREASSRFNLNPAQGWPLSSTSKWIPHNGPFRDWYTAAIAAYHLNGLDKIGATNWTWELVCFYGELFNGFGYRDYHHMHSPYLWGGTNIQTIGKYTSDGEFDAAHMDTQLGIIPIARRMVELDASLALPESIFVVKPPIASGLSVPEDPTTDTKWVQESLNKLGLGPLDVDGNYGRQTKLTVERFQQDYELQVDGFAGPNTIKALKEALAALDAEPK